MREPKQQDICYATQNRQDAVKLLAPQVDVVVVVGSPTSVQQQPPARTGERWARRPSWSMRPDDLKPEWLDGKRRVGAHGRGASAPDVLVQAVIDRLRVWAPPACAAMPGVEEHVRFRCPWGWATSRWPRSRRRDLERAFRGLASPAGLN